MRNQEEQLKDLFEEVAFDDTPNYQHRDALEQRLLRVLAQTSRRDRARTRIGRIIMKSRITQLATAAVIAVALVPLSYGTSRLIKRLAAGSYGSDQCQGQFELDRDIRVELQIGTKQRPQMVSAGNVRFFVEDGQIRGTLRCYVAPWPEFAWRTRIELLDARDNTLHRGEHINANAGVQLPQSRSSFAQSIHFLAGSADSASQVQRFRINLEATSPDEPTTADAWVESTVLPVVHGRVTDAAGAPVAGTIVQIREHRQPGQTSISAPDVLTDRHGLYSYDQIRWPYKVGAIVYEPTPSGRGYRHQYRGWNKVLEGTQCADLAFDRFPVGSASLSGTVTDPNGAIAREFTVDARLRINWDDESAEYRYTYGHREPSVTSDGRFEIRDLAAGTYDVWITPRASGPASEPGRPRRYVCELHAGQGTTVGEQNATEKVWYGRVLFNDGTPAVSESPDYGIQVVAWGSRYTMGRTIATIDSDGYFAAPMPDETMERLQSGEDWLTVTVAQIHQFHGIEREPRFPAEKLSLERDSAGAVAISRPRFYYGRVLYENGKPAVLPVAPWLGARVCITLHDQRATSSGPFIQDPRLDLDETGCFTAYLSEEQLRDIKEGHVQMRVTHPSYAEERVSYYAGECPGEMLTTERSSAKGYVLSFAEMPSGLENLKQYLDSAYNLEALAAALDQYAESHNQNYPGTLQLLATYTTDLMSLRERIEYFPAGTAAVGSEPSETVCAYDRTLLDATGTTHVLFRDGHVEFCRSRRLKILGIGRPDPAMSP